MDCHSIYFEAPFKAVNRQETLAPLLPGQVLVLTRLSAISPGSEMLIYRGQFPQDLAVDETIQALASEFTYPIKYGYSAVGRVIEVGVDVETSWLNQTVFSFHPHQSRFLSYPDQLIPVPEGISIEDAVFLPSVETAVNLVMDGAPLIGEHVTVFGQGIIGLLAASLLAQFPLASLITFEPFPIRRAASIQLGASESLDPLAESFDQAVPDRLLELQPHGADLVYELTGNPAALDLALTAAGYAGRIVVGSWYGQKRASLDLGGRYHRDRIQLISSQVSTIAPALSGRWDKTRRIELAWEMIRHIKPSRFITQRFPLDQSQETYQLIDQHPEQTIQVVFEY